jgi:hypothetical protein
MAKRPTKGDTMGKTTTGRQAIAVTLRGTPAWKDWVEELAEHCRLDVAKVIDRALIDYARKEGFKREAPSR